MSLLTLHTRLTQILAEAQYIRNQVCTNASIACTKDVAATFVVDLAAIIQMTIQNTADKEKDTDLVNYAATQFIGQDWIPLDQQIVGVRSLLQKVIAECVAAVPADTDGYVQKEKLNADGSLTARILTSKDTANLKTALDTVLAAIPE